MVPAENTGFVKINSLKAHLLKANSPNDQVTALLKSCCEVLASLSHPPLRSAYVRVVLLWQDGETDVLKMGYRSLQFHGLLPLLPNLVGSCFLPCLPSTF